MQKVITTTGGNLITDNHDSGSAAAANHCCFDSQLIDKLAYQNRASVPEGVCTQKDQGRMTR